MSEKALIISLNFNPGHVSHLVASYKQCQEIGYDSEFYVNPIFKEFLPKGLKITLAGQNLPECRLAIFLFPSTHNLNLIYKLKKRGVKIAYIFHEPLTPLSQYRAAGFSYLYLAKLWIIDHISALTVKWSDLILLPSMKAENYYWANKLYRNDNATYMPLLFDDELKEPLNYERKYISYIGTVAADHSFEEFIAFVKASLANKWFENKDFLIATKSEVEIPVELQYSSRVKVQKGRPLTDDEINAAFAESAVIWNAYIRSTQSGVLAKSYMFGTPAVVLKKNLNEFMIEAETVVPIVDNKNVEHIKQAIEKIICNQRYYVDCCRELFLKTFYYRNHNEMFKSLVSCL